jgi:L-asparaginase
LSAPADEGGYAVTIAFLPLGGTISMVTSAGEKGAKPRLTGEDLLKASGYSGPVEIGARPPIASANLGLPDLIGVAGEIERAFDGGAQGAVVTLGTDTLEEVAFALDLLIDSDRPMILTGAMRFANQPGSEGAANLRAAFDVASDLGAGGRGVLVVMNDEIHAARFVTKANTISTAAFSSAPFGPIGIVQEGGALWAFRPDSWPGKWTAAPVSPQVPILTPGIGDDPGYLEALLARPPDGAIVAALGAGHVPARMVAVLEKLAGRCPVVLASRILAGPTLRRTYGYPGAEMDLIGRGLIPSGILNAAKAKMALQILLSTGRTIEEIRSAFETLQP